MSPTSSSVIFSSSSDDSAIDVGRTTSSAASKSAIATCTGSVWDFWRSAARTPASRASAARSAATNPGVREATSSSRTSSASGMPRVSTSSCSRRSAASGSGTAISCSSNPGERSDGSTASGRLVVHATATPARSRSSSIWRNTVVTGPGLSRGARASTSAITSTAGPRPRTASAARRSRAAASLLARAATSGAQSSSTRALTVAATARTSEDLPDPAGPVMSTPSATVVPRRLSTSRWLNPRSSSSVSCLACARRPGRSSTAGAGAESSTVGAGTGVPGAWVTWPPCQPTAVSMVTSAASGGSAAVTVSRVLVQAYPTVLDRRWRALSTRPRTASAGMTSCGSRETLSSTVTTLPSSASRSTSGESQRGRDHGHEPIAQLDHSRAAYAGGMPLPTRLRRALPRPRLNRRRVLAASVVLLLVAGLVGWAVWPRPASYTVEDATITVRSGPADDQEISLDTRLYLPKAATSARPVPAILLAHGFGGTKLSVATDAEDLADLGYAVLTWTAQGFGRSSGQIHLDSPDWEVKDASRLVDWLAARPEIAKQAVGDPRVAAVGGSYGGALALLLAAYDRRVDAIVPMITWNDLARSFLPEATGGAPVDGVFKKQWAGWFFGSGGSVTDSLA